VLVQAITDAPEGFWLGAFSLAPYFADEIAANGAAEEGQEKSYGEWQKLVPPPRKDGIGQGDRERKLDETVRRRLGRLSAERDEGLGRDEQRAEEGQEKSYGEWQKLVPPPRKDLAPGEVDAESWRSQKPSGASVMMARKSCTASVRAIGSGSSMKPSDALDLEHLASAYSPSTRRAG
jgi:hypothetical protein